MFEPIHHKTATLPLPNSISQSPSWRRGFILIMLALACFELSPASQALNPPPDGGYANFNTAEGTAALHSLTTGYRNTAVGFHALYSNTTGFENTATGFAALASNTGTIGVNTADGAYALYSNTTGEANAATGVEALGNNTTGVGNTATGIAALGDNTSGDDNTAIGASALLNTTGNDNIALGVSAGEFLSTGDNNIDIGNTGVAAESNTIRIGTVGAQTATFIAGIHGVTVASAVGVVVDVNGHLGTVTSSARFKEAIKPMDKASETILALKPVTFRYKHELDPEGIPQFGLIAEQVEKVNPDLVARDEQGKVYTVRYEAVNAMLLSEFLKEHRKVEEQYRKGQEAEMTIAQLKSIVTKQEATIAQQQKEFHATIAQQEKQIEALTVTVQKVSEQVALSKPAPQLVTNP